MMLQRLITSSYRCSRVYNRSVLSYISSYNDNTSATTINQTSNSVSTINYSHYQALQQHRCIYVGSSIGSGDFISTSIHQYSSTSTILQKDVNNTTELNEFGTELDDEGLERRVEVHLVLENSC